MNNQAAQTMPELPHTNLLHMYGADFINVYTADQMHQYARDYAAALSQTAGVADGGLETFTDYFVKNYPGPDTIIHDPKWHAPRIFRAAQRAIQSAAPAASGVDTSTNEAWARRAQEKIAAMDAASGGEDDPYAFSESRRQHEAACRDRMNVSGVFKAEPPSAASVSERAREAWEDFVGCHLGDDEGEASLQTSGLCRMAFDAGMRASSEPSIEGAIVALVGALQRGKGWMRDYADAIVRDAIDRRGLDEQALTQQRGEDDRSFAGLGADITDETIDCEVAVAPASTFGIGVKLSTVVQAIRMRSSMEGTYAFTNKVREATSRPDTGGHALPGDDCPLCNAIGGLTDLRHGDGGHKRIHCAKCGKGSFGLHPLPGSTTPQPGAEALRELVQRWRNEFGEFHEAKLDCADELESLLARGGK